MEKWSEGRVKERKERRDKRKQIRAAAAATTTTTTTTTKLNRKRAKRLAGVDYRPGSVCIRNPPDGLIRIRGPYRNE